jgi:hypothetical protein
MKYSKASGGFYHPSIHYSEIPDDAIDVDASTYMRAINICSDEYIDIVDGKLVIEKIEQPESFLKEIKKAELKIKLEIITVDVDGYVFNADKNSRDLMAQAVSVAQYAGRTSAYWKLADNNWAEVTLEQLQQAITLGLQKHGDLLVQYS